MSRAKVRPFRETGTVSVYSVRSVPEERVKVLHAWKEKEHAEMVLPGAAAWWFEGLDDFAIIDFKPAGKPPVWAFQRPIELHGGVHDGRRCRIRYMGSNGKNGKFIAMFGNDDPLVECGVATDAYRVIYTGTYFQGTQYTSAVLKNVDILFTDWELGLDKKTGRELYPYFVGKVTGRTYRMAEGMFLIEEWLARALLEGNTGSLFNFKRDAKACYLFDANLNWMDEKLFEILQKGLDKAIKRANNPALLKLAVIAEDAWREKLLAWCPALDGPAGLAPYLANHLADNHATFMRMVARSHIYDGEITRAAFPVPHGHVVLGGEKTDEKYADSILIRQPSISPNASMAVRVEVEGEWSEWIAQLKLMQGRLFNMEIFMKGLGGIVPDGELGGYDFVMPGDNVKLAVGPLNKARRTGARRYEELFWLTTQVFLPGMGIGMPPELMKVMEGDFDGDLCQIIPCNGTGYEYVWNEVYSWPRWETHKEKRVRMLITEKVDMRTKVFQAIMQGWIGQATNVASAVAALSTDNLIALALAINLSEPSLINENYPEWMSPTPYRWRELGALAHVADFTQVATDLGKSPQNADSLRKTVAATRGIVIDTLDKNAEFPRAEREAWFVHGTEIPMPGDDDVGMIHKIMKYVVPQLKWPRIDPVAPLSYFASWVPVPEDSLLEAVSAFYRTFCAQVAQVNLMDTRTEGALALFKRDIKRQNERAFVMWAAKKTAIHLPKCEERLQLRSELFTHEVFMGLDSCRHAVKELGDIMVAKHGADPGQITGLLRRLGPEAEFKWAQAIWYKAHADTERESKQIRYSGTMPFWALREDMLFRVLDPDQIKMHQAEFKARAAAIRVTGVQYTMRGETLPQMARVRFDRFRIQKDPLKPDLRRVMLFIDGVETSAKDPYPEDSVATVDINCVVTAEQCGVLWEARIEPVKGSKGSYDVYIFMEEGDNA